jgi:hypothetical protein
MVAAIGSVTVVASGIPIGAQAAMMVTSNAMLLAILK